MKPSKNLRKRCLYPLLILIPCISYNLKADTIRVSAGAWGGGQRSELEAMSSMDRLIDDNLYKNGGVSLGSLTLGWNSRDTTSAPVSLRYFYDLKGRNWNRTRIMVGGAAVQNRADYRYYSLDEQRTFGMGGFLSDTWTDADGEIGIQLPPFLGGKLILIPEVGQRNHSYRSKWSEFRFADNTAATSVTSIGPSTLKANAKGSYGGVNLELKLSRTISLVGEYKGFSSLRGNANQLVNTIDSGTVTVAGVTSPFFSFDFTSIISNYRLSGSEQFLALKFDLKEEVKNLSLVLGMRNETMRVSYPGYFKLFSAGEVTVAGTSERYFNAPVTADLVSNLMIYGSSQTRSKGSIYAGITYDYDLAPSQPAPRRRR